MTIENVTPDDAGELLELYAPYIRETAITFEKIVGEHTDNQKPAEWFQNGRR